MPASSSGSHRPVDEAVNDRTFGSRAEAVSQSRHHQALVTTPCEANKDNGDDELYGWRRGETASCTRHQDSGTAARSMPTSSSGSHRPAGEDVNDRTFGSRAEAVSQPKHRRALVTTPCEANEDDDDDESLYGWRRGETASRTRHQDSGTTSRRR